MNMIKLNDARILASTHDVAAGIARDSPHFTLDPRRSSSTTNSVATPNEQLFHYYWNRTKTAIAIDASGV